MVCNSQSRRVAAVPAKSHGNKQVAKGLGEHHRRRQAVQSLEKRLLEAAVVEEIGLGVRAVVSDLELVIATFVISQPQLVRTVHRTSKHSLSRRLVLGGYRHGNGSGWTIAHRLLCYPHHRRLMITKHPKKLGRYTTVAATKATTTKQIQSLYSYVLLRRSVQPFPTASFHSHNYWQVTFQASTHQQQHQVRDLGKLFARRKHTGFKV